MEDMKCNTRRSIRNLIDLGRLFARSENQKWFYNTARQIIANPRNPYNSLVKRVISDIDNNTVKTVGLNLGYSTLAYGAGKLKKRQDSLSFPIPWFLIFDITEPSFKYYFQMEQLIKEGRELGIYSYVICPHEEMDIPIICEIAEQFEECLFILAATSDLVSEQAADSLGKIHNAMISVQMAETDFNCERDANAFRLLRQSRCLYGFHVSYNEDTMKQVTSPKYIDSAINLGNLFGIYISENGVSETCRNAVYTFVCNERGGAGQPLVTMEWYRDIGDISRKILSCGGYMEGNPVERVCSEYIKAIDVLTKSLLEILQSRQLCTDVRARPAGKKPTWGYQAKRKAYSIHEKAR